MLREFIEHLNVFSVSLYHDCNVRRTMGVRGPVGFTPCMGGCTGKVWCASKRVGGLG